MVLLWATGVVDNKGQFPNGHGLIQEYLVTGPMCRHADDLLPMLKVMAGEGRKKLKLDEPVSKVIVTRPTFKK